MAIDEVMSKGIFTVRKDQTIEDALRLMNKHKISRLPVISASDNNKLVGIITEKDMATKIASSKYEDLPLSHMRVSTIMTPNVITASKDDAKVVVLKVMVDNHIGGIPIVDGEEIIGMVTKTDFLKDMDLDVYKDTPIKDIMTRRVVTVNPDDRIVHARRLMIDKHISRLVVVNSGVIVGIITAKDMAKTIIDFKKRVPEKYQENQIRNLFVQEVMSQTIETTTKETSIADVADVMVTKEFSGMPVSENNKVQGIVSKTDILRFVYDHNRKRGNY